MSPEMHMSRLGKNLLLTMAQMRAAFLDWNENYTGPKFDLVLACDVLYEVSIPSHGRFSFVFGCAALPHLC